MHHFVKWVEIDHKCNKMTNSIAWVPEMTLFLFLWTRTHMYTRRNRLPLSGRMLRDSVVCSAESHRNWQIRHKSLLPPTIHKKSVTGPPEINSDWSVSFKMEVMFAVLSNFSEEFASHSQLRHTDTVPTIPMSRPNVCTTRRGFVTACQACYFTVEYDISSSFCL